MLDVKSTEKGFLPPRMTIAQRDAIVSPAEGLMVICIDCGFSSSAILNQTTSSCWTCGQPFTDSRDNKVYGTVLIGTQCWMAGNLKLAYGLMAVRDKPIMLPSRNSVMIILNQIVTYMEAFTNGMRCLKRLKACMDS